MQSALADISHQSTGVNLYSIVIGLRAHNRDRVVFSQNVASILIAADSGEARMT
jgi:hypothetical protein